MKKLRLAQERRRDEPTEFDLRGFGNDPLINRAFPFTALAVTSTKSPHIDNTMLEKFGFQKHEAGNTTLVYPRQMSDGEHKEQAVRLFSMVLAMAGKSNDSYRIFEVNALKIHLSGAEKSSKRLTTEELMLTAHQQLSATNHLVTLETQTAMHLKQAGFPIQVSESLTTFTVEQFKLLSMHIQMELTQAQNMNRKRA